MISSQTRTFSLALFFTHQHLALHVIAGEESDNKWGIDSLERVLLGVGLVLVFVLIIIAFLYKKYKQQQSNTHVAPVGQDNASGTAQRMQVPGGQRGVVVTPGQPGVYPPTEVVLAPPPYSPNQPGGTDAVPPPPAYDDIIKDAPPEYLFDPPNYINTEPPPAAPPLVRTVTQIGDDETATQLTDNNENNREAATETVEESSNRANADTLTRT